MAERRVDILIAIEARLKAIEAASKEFEKLKKKGQEAGESIQAGLGIAVAERVVQGFGIIGRAMANAVAEGLRFNATVQDAQVGVAAVLKQFSPERYQTFQQALAASGDAIDLLKEKARQSPATFEQLVGAFQAVSGAASAANIPVKKQIDLVVLMSQALSGLGIRSDQIIQESRALLTGNITEDAAAARILGISKADIDQAKQAGQLYEFLTGKLSGFAEAAQVGSRGLNTQLANLTDNLQQLKGAATEELLGPLTDDLIKLNEFLGGKDSRAAAGGIGALLRDYMNQFRALKQSADEFMSSFGLNNDKLNRWSMNINPVGRTLNKGVIPIFQGGRDASLITQYQKQEQTLLSIVRSAKTEKEIADARKLIGEVIVEQQGRIAQQGENVNVIETQHLQAATNIRSAFDQIVGTQKEHSTAVAEQSATYSQIQAMQQSVDKTLGSQLRTAVAKATENEELLRQTQELARLEELIGKAAKEGTLEYRMRREYAQQIVEAERAIADSERRKRISESTRTIRENNAKDEREQLQLLRDQIDEKQAELKVFADRLGIQNVPDAPSSADALNLHADFVTDSDTDALRTRAAELSGLEAQARSLEERVNDSQAKYNRALAEANETQGDLLNKVTSHEERQRMIADRVASLRADYKGIGVSEQELLELATRQIDNEEKKKRAVESQRDARKESTKLLRDERDLLQDIASLLTTIDSDPFLTREQKDERRVPLLERQRELLLQRKGNGESVDGELAQNDIEQARATPAGQMRENWTQFVDSLPSSAEAASQAITSTLGTAINGISNGISGLIMGTQNWRQAFAQTASAIIEQLVRIGVEFIAHEVLKMTWMQTSSAKASALRIQETAQVTGQQAQQAAAAAPNALMQSLASWGVSAIVGAAAFAAAMALSGGFAEGGYTGGGGRMEPAGVVHKGEYVFSQPAVNRLGISYLDSLHVNAKRGYAGGGAVGSQNAEPLAGAGGSARPVNTFVLFDENTVRKQMLEHPDADNRVVRVGRRRGSEMGINRA